MRAGTANISPKMGDRTIFTEKEKGFPQPDFLQIRLQFPSAPPGTVLKENGERK